MTTEETEIVENDQQADQQPEETVQEKVFADPSLKREQKALDYYFTAIEMVDMAQKVGEIFREIEAEKSQAKAHAAAHKAKIEEWDLEFAKLSNFLADKKEVRDIMCAVEYNVPTDGIKTYTRLDNGQKFTAQMEAHEWNLFTQGKSNNSEKTEEEQAEEDAHEISSEINEEAILEEDLNVSDVPKEGEGNFGTEEKTTDEFDGSYKKPSDENAFNPPKGSRRSR